MPTLPSHTKRPWIKESKAFEGMNTNFNYNATLWRKRAKLFLKSNPLCKMCNNEGIYHTARIVDHVVPINMGCDPWDESNWQGLCTRHNSIKTGRQSRQGK